MTGFGLPQLAYGYDALEPHIDEMTMRIHHTKHHQAYIDNANKALEGKAQYSGIEAEKLLKDFEKVPDELKTVLRNNVGGHANHTLFWTVIGPGCGGEPSGELKKAMDKAFGRFSDFQEKFSNAAKTRFGSGWAWLVMTKEKKLEVYSTQNQDSPLMEGKTPLLGLDVWEHAYYLKYQNKRPDYINAFWNIVNWTEAERRYKEALR
jgi:Fe-Mn family superoxide dismutase